MSHALIEAAERLRATLLAENAALEALDFPRAAALLKEKEAATLAFSQAQAGAQAAAQTAGAQAGARAARTLVDAGLRAQALELGRSLQVLVEANRALLQRAIDVQGRVIGIVTGAARQAMPAPGYGMRGRPASAGRAAAYALVARA